MTARGDIGALLTLIGSARLPLGNEKALQEALSETFSAAGVGHDREHLLPPKGPGAPGRDVVDFMLDGGVAIECKLRAGKKAIYRQLCRYARHPEVHAIVLVSNTAMGL